MSFCDLIGVLDRAIIEVWGEGCLEHLPLFELISTAALNTLLSDHASALAFFGGFSGTHLHCLPDDPPATVLYKKTAAFGILVHILRRCRAKQPLSD